MKAFYLSWSGAGFGAEPEPEPERSGSENFLTGAESERSGLKLCGVGAERERENPGAAHLCTGEISGCVASLKEDKRVLTSF